MNRPIVQNLLKDEAVIEFNNLQSILIEKDIKFSDQDSHQQIQNTFTQNINDYQNNSRQNLNDSPRLNTKKESLDAFSLQLYRKNNSNKQDKSQENQLQFKCYTQIDDNDFEKVGFFDDTKIQKVNLLQEVPRSVTPLRNQFKDIKQYNPIVQNNEQYLTPNTKQNQVYSKFSKPNNKIYDRSIKTNPLTKSRSSSQSKQNHNNTQDNQTINDFNSNNDNTDNSIDYKNEIKIKDFNPWINGIFKEITQENLQQNCFNETAKFGQKFNSFDEQKCSPRSPEKRCFSKNGQSQKRNTHEAIISGVYGKPKIINYQQNKFKPFQKLQTENENKNLKQMKYSTESSKEDVINSPRHNNIININKLNKNYENEFYPFGDRINIAEDKIRIVDDIIKYQSSSPKSNILKLNKDNSKDYKIENKLNSPLKDQDNMNFNKQYAHFFPINNKFTKKFSFNKDTSSNIQQNKQSEIENDKYLIHRNDSNTMHPINAHLMASSSPISNRMKIDKNMLINQQSFEENILDTFPVYKPKGGVRACSPGGCRIKVLPIKTNGGILSEFQSFNSREGSPSFNKMRKLKQNENMEQLEQQAPVNQQNQ